MCVWGWGELIIPKSESSVRAPSNSNSFIRSERQHRERERESVCPISEATQEVGHALCRVSKRGWEKERRRGSRKRGRAL